MPLILEANYSKKLGLPDYSSHQYSLTLRVELSDLKQVESESQRLYALLQGCADRELQTTGFLPGQTQNGNGSHPANGPGQPSNCNGNGQVAALHSNGNGYANGHSEAWNCSAKQKELILKIVEEQRIPKAEVEKLSQQLFGLGVKSLNKLQASGLISELTAEPGKAPVPTRSTAPRASTGGWR